MSADRVAHRAVGASWSIILRGFVAGWRLVLLLPLRIHVGQRCEVDGDGGKRIVRARKLTVKKLLVKLHSGNEWAKMIEVLWNVKTVVCKSVEGNDEKDTQKNLGMTVDLMVPRVTIVWFFRSAR